MKIINECEMFTSDELATIEKKYNAKFVCETCISDGKSWLNELCAIFYTPEPHPEGSNYFALFFRAGAEFQPTLMIADGITAAKTPINGVVAKNGDIIYSKYRWDYRESKDGSVIVDGGRDYLKRSKGGKVVQLVIKKDKLVVDD